MIEKNKEIRKISLTEIKFLRYFNHELRITPLEQISTSPTSTVITG